MTAQAAAEEAGPFGRLAERARSAVAWRQAAYGFDWCECEYVPYEGGLVLNPQRGCWENVAVLDCWSMHPSPAPSTANRFPRSPSGRVRFDTRR